jgi:type IV secretory pathway VirB9-like protein
MKKRLTLLCGFVTLASVAAFGQAAKHAAPSNAAITADITPSAMPSAKVIDYGDKDVIPVKTKLRFTTLIVLPKNEQILDFTCGDKELWVVNGNQNFAYVKPAKAALRRT